MDLVRELESEAAAWLSGYIHGAFDTYMQENGIESEGLSEEERANVRVTFNQRKMVDGYMKFLNAAGELDPVVSTTALLVISRLVVEVNDISKMEDYSG